MTDEALLNFLREWLSSGLAKNTGWREGYYRFGQQGFLPALARAVDVSEAEAPGRMNAFTAQVGGFVVDTGGTELIPRGETPIVRDWYIPVGVIDNPGEAGSS